MDIKAIQQRLIALGYDVGPAGADGVEGRATRAAIAKFQADRKVDVQWPGTIGPKTVAALNDVQTGTAPIIIDKDHKIEPPWHVEMRRKLGLHETRDNKTLREYLKSDGSTLGDPAVLPWCGDLMETVIALTLPAEPMVTNPYYALNWMKFGVPLKTGLVPLGAIAPFERRDSKGKLLGGHIGEIVGHDKDYFHVMGGNQSNAITITKIAKNRLSGPLRWPSTYPLPTASLPLTSLNATISTNEA